ncbi:MAG: cell division protein ZapA [Clostridia bacterium]|nr:cell division protein ZapA [Clostridia bacterium]
MGSSNKVNVKIYGQEFTIAGDTSREHIEHVAEYVDKKMHEISAAFTKKNPVTVAILAAVNAADDYFEQLEKNQSLQEVNEQLTKDTDHYVMLWEECKTNFVQCKEEAASTAKQKEELMTKAKEQEDEIAKLRAELEDMKKSMGENSDRALSQAEEKYKDLENNFFEIQMENIRLKNENEKMKKDLK